MAHMAQSKWSQAEDWLSITGRVEMSLWEPSCPGHSPVTWKSEHRTDTIDLRCCKNGISRLSWFAVNHFHIPGSAMWTGPTHRLSSNSSRQYVSAGLARHADDFVILISRDFCTVWDICTLGPCVHQPARLSSADMGIRAASPGSSSHISGKPRKGWS